MQMRIGFDIDNVISDFDKKLWEEFLKEDKKKRNRGIINPNGNWIKDCFDWSKEEVEEFYMQHMEEFAKTFELRENAKYYMDKLAEEGHSIYLISHRAFPHYQNPDAVTKKWLEEKGIPYTKLVLTESTNKTKECKENNVDIMFDDVVSNCYQLQESGVNVYLVKTNYFPNRPNPESLKVVENWKEIYEAVHKLKKKKVILDTDMYNEIDDQFALAYLMKSLDCFDVEAITIAPFSKSHYARTMPATIAEGTQKSYETTLNLLDMLEKKEYKEKVFPGAIHYLKDSEATNEAVEKIIEIVKKNEKTTILAIGAITNIALAIRKAPEIISKMKVVWLGGNSFLSKNNDEFNFRQDIQAVQTVFDSQVELVVIPCRNVAANLTTTIYELEHYLQADSELNQYLLERFRECKKAFMKEQKDEIGSSKTLWDLSAVAYEINADWFQADMISCPKVLENGCYEKTTERHSVIFVNDLYRKKIYQDFFLKMQK